MRGLSTAQYRALRSWTLRGKYLDATGIHLFNRPRLTASPGIRRLWVERDRAYRRRLEQTLKRCVS